MRKLAGIVFASLPMLLMAQPSSPSEIRVDIEHINDHVIVARCPVGTNVTAINTSRGVVVIDTHLSPTTMQAIRLEIERVFDTSAFTFVVNTHGDWDHCSGNQIFRDATIVGHESAPVFMSRHVANTFSVTWWQESLLSRDRHALESTGGAGGEPDLRAQIETRERILADLRSTYVSTPPTLTFQDHYTLDLGDMTVELMYCGPAHTITDIFAYVPGEKILITGDVFCSPKSFCFKVSPLIDLDRLLVSIDYALERGVDVVVPGHGTIMGGDDLRALRDRLASERERQSGRVSAAKTLEAAIEQRGVDEAVRRFPSAISDTSRVGYFAEEEFYVAGNRLADRGGMEAAVAVFELACGYFPESSLLFGALGGSRLVVGDTLSAISAYERAYELAPYNRQVEAILGHLRSR